MPQSTLVTSRSSDEGIDCMLQKDFNVVEALHAELEVKTNMDSISIISDPIKASINAPNLMEEVNGVVNSISNQNPTSELFEIPIKGVDEGVTRFVYDTYFESRQNKEAEFNGDIPFHIQHATSAENQGARQAQNYSKSVANTEEGRKFWGKRSGDVRLKLPSKNRWVSKDESDKLFSMVEADAQPCQT